MTRVAGLAVALSLALTLCFSADARSQFRPAGDASDDVYQKSNAGDPTAVALILKLLDRCAVSPGEEHHNENYAAIAGVRLYRLEEAGPVLATIYQNPRTPVLMKDALAEAAAEIHSPASRRFLAVLRDDADVKLRTHLLVLAALVRLDDDSARRELAESYRKFLDAPPSSQFELANIPFVLETTGDTKLVESIQEMRDSEIDSTKKSAIAEVIARMKMNDLSIDELFKIAQESDYAKVGDARTQAIRIVAERGGLDVIPRIESLKNWTNLPPGRERSLISVFPIQKQSAAAQIRRRHWQEMQKHPATIPVDSSE